MSAALNFRADGRPILMPDQAADMYNTLSGMPRMPSSRQTAAATDRLRKHCAKGAV